LIAIETSLWIGRTGAHSAPDGAATVRLGMTGAVLPQR